jgi:uncharacterized YccA/Bax inhibitor family protein
LSFILIAFDAVLLKHAPRKANIGVARGLSTTLVTLYVGLLRMMMPVNPRRLHDVK